MTEPREQRRRRRIAIALAFTALAVPVFATACGDSDTDKASDTTAAAATSAEPATTEATTTTAAAPVGPTKVTVTAADYKFEGLPSALAVGSEIALTNSSAKELHEMVVIKLPDTEKRSAEELAKLPMDQLESLLTGPPTMVLIAPPSQAGFAVVGDGKLTEPGRYLAICSIPVGADPAAYMAAAAKAKGGPVSVPGGPPHMAEGMYAGFTVQ